MTPLQLPTDSLGGSVPPPDSGGGYSLRNSRIRTWTRSTQDTLAVDIQLPVNEMGEALGWHYSEQWWESPGQNSLGTCGMPAPAFRKDLVRMLFTSPSTKEQFPGTNLKGEQSPQTFLLPELQRRG